MMSNPVPLEAHLLTASPADIRKVCVRLHLENSERTMLTSQRTPDEHPPPPPPCRWPDLITLPTLAKFQLVWRRLCDVLFRSSCLFEHPYGRLCTTRVSVVIMRIQTVCDHLNILHISTRQTCTGLESGRSSTAPVPV